MKHSNRSIGVARRLGLPEGLTSKPPFMTMLSYAAYKLGGKHRFMELAKLSNNDEVKRLVYIWNKLSKSDRRYVSLDDLCKAAGVDSNVLLLKAVSVDNLLECSISMRIIDLIMSQSVIVQTNIKKALKPNGYKERVKVLKAMGLLPPNTRYS